MLNELQIKNIQNAEKVIFTTSSSSNQPRSIWVVPSKIEKNRIVISNIQMGKSFENIKENSKCFINVLIPEHDDLQYKIEGIAKIYYKGRLFEDIKKYEETENLPPELKVNAIIVIELTSFEQSNG